MSRPDDEHPMDRAAREARRYVKRRKSPDAAAINRRYNLKSKFGLTPEQFDDMLKAQSGVCAICGRQPEGRLHVDHDHASGRVRGLLCRPCNVGIGHFEESVERLKNAIAYIQKGNNAT